MNGWARIYETVEVTDYDGAGTLLQYQRPPPAVSAIWSTTTAKPLSSTRCATSPTDTSPMRRAGRRPEVRLDTHIHADHMSGVRGLDAAGVEGVIPAAAVDRGVTYAAEQSSASPVSQARQDADDLTTAEDGDTFEVGDVTIETVATPGHTTGMTSYTSTTACSPPVTGCSSRVSPDPTSKRATRAHPTRLGCSTSPCRSACCSHDETPSAPRTSATRPIRPTTAATPPARGTDEEMDALTMDEDDFVETILADMPPRPANYEDIIATNLGRNTVDDEEAFDARTRAEQLRGEPGSARG